MLLKIEKNILQIKYECKIFEEELNKFFTKSKLDLKVYRFKSMLRLVYSKSLC